MRVAILAVLIACSLIACEAKAPGQPVVVYAAYPEGPYLLEYFRGFTEESGIPVSVIFGDSLRHVELIIANRGSPPADVFITREIEHLWRAGEGGALRPIQGKNVAAVPAFLKDGDNLWAAMNYQIIVIASYSPMSDGRPLSYVELADPGYHGQICVSSSRLAANRSIMAMLIDALGPKKAERAVRGWMQNLAKTPLKSGRELLAAVEAGDCKFALLSGWNYGRSSSTQVGATTQVIHARPGYVEIEGVGIARHSRNSASAQKLVDWLLSEPSNRQHASALRAYSVYAEPRAELSRTNVGIAGWRDEDARRLAERAGYR